MWKHTALRHCNINLRNCYKSLCLKSTSQQKLSISSSCIEPDRTECALLETPLSFQKQVPVLPYGICLVFQIVEALLGNGSGCGEGACWLSRKAGLSGRERVIPTGGLNEGCLAGEQCPNHKIMTCEPLRPGHSWAAPSVCAWVEFHSF